MKRSALAVALAFVALSCNDSFVSPSPPPPPEPEVVSLSLSPETATVDINDNLIITVNMEVKNGASKACNCSATFGTLGGVVNSTHVYTAPETPTTDTVTCVSVADPSKSATAVITVVEPPRVDQIVFWRSHDDNGDCPNLCEDLFLLDVGSNKPVQVTSSQEQDLEPTWSHDGRQVFYSHGGWLTKMDIESGDTTTLTSNRTFGQPSLSPDEQEIAVFAITNDSAGIGVMSIDGTNFRFLSAIPCVSSCRPDMWPDWSHDGLKIYFLSQRDSDGEFYVMDRDGSSQTRITNTPDALEGGLKVSPDGLKIAYHARTGDEFSIYVMNINDDNPPVRLSEGVSPNWTPDGTRILFSLNAGTIAIMNADGSEKITLFSDGYLVGDPAWRP